MARISSWDILFWSSSVEKVDDYARLFYNYSEIFEQDSFLCNCNKGYFAKWCKILCHQTLECDHGLLCLDWRNICDGQQHCMNGIDEENCDLLEFNECDESEYRYEGGMYIAEEYWLDDTDGQDNSFQKLSTETPMNVIVIHFGI